MMSRLNPIFAKIISLITAAQPRSQVHSLPLAAARGGEAWRRNVRWPVHIMGWLWLVGSIKLQVSFAKELYRRDDILQKRPIILLILLTVAAP